MVLSVVAPADTVRGPADVEVVGGRGLEYRPGAAGASNTMVPGTSTWRIDSSYRYPDRSSARVSKIGTYAFR